MAIFGMFKKKGGLSPPPPLDEPPPLDAPGSLPPLGQQPPLGSPPGQIGQPPLDNPFDHAPDLQPEPAFQTSTSFDRNNYDQPQFNPIRQSSGPQGIDHKDVQLILARLDTIKAEIDNINQRLMSIERIAGEPDKKNQRYQW